MSKFWKILVMLSLVANIVLAQDAENEEQLDIKSQKEKKETQSNPDEIKTLSGHVGHSGAFGALSFKGSSFNDKSVMMLGVRGGWIINRTVAIGLEGYGIVPSSKYDMIDPYEDMRLLGGYGGIFIEPIIMSNKAIHVTFPISSGAGWLGYHHDWGNDISRANRDDLIDDDVFWYIEPGVSVEINIVKNMRLAVGASKRITQDLELIDTPSSAFDKMNYFMTLKIGVF